MHICVQTRSQCRFLNIGRPNSPNKLKRYFELLSFVTLSLIASFSLADTFYPALSCCVFLHCGDFNFLNQHEKKKGADKIKHLKRQNYHAIKITICMDLWRFLMTR